MAQIQCSIKEVQRTIKQFFFSHDNASYGPFDTEEEAKAHFIQLKLKELFNEHCGNLFVPDAFAKIVMGHQHKIRDILETDFKFLVMHK